MPNGPLDNQDEDDGSPMFGPNSTSSKKDNKNKSFWEIGKELGKKMAKTENDKKKK